MIEAAVLYILTHRAELTALVADRVYPQTLPQKPILPAITYTRTGTYQGYTKDGPEGAATPNFQVDIWNPDLVNARQVAAQVKAAMHAAWSTTVAGVRLGRIECTDDRDAYDQNVKVVGVTLDFSVQHRV